MAKAATWYAGGRWRWIVLAWALACATAVPAQNGARRTRLFLKDGSYQVVLGYTVKGQRVSYRSAERAGETEEIPLALVDLARTEQWARDHAPDATAAGTAQAPEQPPVIDPELAREEADRAALTPEVAPDLRLPIGDSVLALDTFRGTPELIPLAQSSSELNRQTGHSVLKGIVNPASSSHQIVVLKGETSPIQVHVADPEIFIRLDSEQPAGGAALTVDTHGSSAARDREPKTQPTAYVISRAEIRQNARVVASFNTGMLGNTTRQQDIVETTATVLPGGHWMKVVPREPLLVGEYALVEVLGPNQLNLGVWDFGVRPTAPENRDALHPEKRRAGSLERRVQPR